MVHGAAVRVLRGCAGIVLIGVSQIRNQCETVVGLLIVTRITPQYPQPSAASTRPYRPDGHKSSTRSARYWAAPTSLRRGSSS